MIRDPASYNAGVMAALDLARRSRDGMPRTGLHRTRWTFGAAALDGLIIAGRELLIPPAGDAPVAVAPLPLAPAPAGEGVAG